MPDRNTIRLADRNLNQTEFLRLANERLAADASRAAQIGHVATKPETDR